MTETSLNPRTVPHQRVHFIVEWEIVFLLRLSLRVVFRVVRIRVWITQYYCFAAAICRDYCCSFSGVLSIMYIYIYVCVYRMYRPPFPERRTAARGPNRGVLEVSGGGFGRNTRCNVSETEEDKEPSSLINIFLWHFHNILCHLLPWNPCGGFRNFSGIQLKWTRANLTRLELKYWLTFACWRALKVPWLTRV